MNIEVQQEFMNVLIEQTKAKIISWSKESNLAYSARIEGVRLLVDKYFSRLNDQLISCVNLTLFDQEDNIIDEIVACNATAIGNDYTLLNGLYKEIELQTKEHEDEHKNAVIVHLTQSIKKLKVS